MLARFYLRRTFISFKTKGNDIRDLGRVGAFRPKILSGYRRFPLTGFSPLKQITKSNSGVDAGNKRNISIYGNRLYIGTSDVHVAALDVKSGRVGWDQPLTKERGFTLTGGPLVTKG